MDPSIKDIPSLIAYLADKHHAGAASAMAKPLGVSISTPSFWKRGVVTPKLENLERLCQVYHLKFDEVRALRRRPRKVAPISGGSDGTATPLLAKYAERLSLIRRWLEMLVARPLLPGYACA